MISTEDLQQTSSVNLILSCDETLETTPLSPGEIALYYVEYNPIQQLTQFGSSIAVQSYHTLLRIITEYGSSIQKGYNEIVVIGFPFHV